MPGTATILVVDDDRDVLTAARLALRAHFREVLTCEDPAGIEPAMADGPVDVFLLDMNFAIGQNSGAEGLHWLRRIRTLDPDAVVVLMTAFGDLNMAVRAMREGAADFVLKPWQNDKLVATVRVAADLRRSRTKVRALAAPSPDAGIVARAPAMREVLRLLERVAPTDASVLLRGENGTGKELVARELHRLSARAGMPFVAIDLGAVPETLFESELFGHVRGAFTGADSDRAGRFQAADGGTLFLDEIGNLPAALQARLLRVLETRELVPLGSSRAQSVDVRLVAATNQPLEDMLADGTFREDLLYRLNTVEIRLPPLRERPEDLPALIDHFLARFSRKYRQPPRRLSPAALKALREHRWPGNVRELAHTIERALILAEGEALEAADLRLAAAPPASLAADLNLDANERRLVATALERHSGNVSRAASELGITRAALYRRIEKFDL